MKVIKRILISVAILAVFFAGVEIYDNKVNWISVSQEDNVFEDDRVRYHYDQLDEDKQLEYKRMYIGLNRRDEYIRLKLKKLEEVEEILTAVEYDHPEYFFFGYEYSYIDEEDYIEFYPSYDYDEKETKDYMEAVEENTKEIIETAKKADTDLKKVQIFYEYLIESIDYKETDGYDQKILSAFIEKETVCAGYAKGYQYLLNQVGIKNAAIIGRTLIDSNDMDAGVLHAWVMVELDGEYYYCDPTWGDVDNKDSAHSCYGYFLMNSEEMLRCYQPTTGYENTVDEKINYFKNTSTYMEKYDRNAIDKAVKNGLENNRVAEVKCANDKIYQELKKKADHTHLLYEILYSNNCWSSKATYLFNDELRMLEIYY